MEPASAKKNQTAEANREFRKALFPFGPEFRFETSQARNSRNLAFLECSHIGTRFAKRTAKRLTGRKAAIKEVTK